MKAKLVFEHDDANLTVPLSPLFAFIIRYFFPFLRPFLPSEEETED